MKTQDPYGEAMRYIDNAREQLALAGRDGKFYEDEKYVQTASGTAYVGMLKALDFLFGLKNVPKQRGRKSIEYYQQQLSKLDKKLLNHLNSAYTILHLDAYYGGMKSRVTIEDGFDSAIAIINALKPYSQNSDSVN